MHTKTSTTRSFRVDDEVWEHARARAESEGRTMSTVLQLLTEGYAKGKIKAPKVQVVYNVPTGK